MARCLKIKNCVSKQENTESYCGDMFPLCLRGCRRGHEWLFPPGDCGSRRGSIWSGVSVAQFYVESEQFAKTFRRRKLGDLIRELRWLFNGRCDVPGRMNPEAQMLLQKDSDDICRWRTEVFIVRRYHYPWRGSQVSWSLSPASKWNIL